MQFSVRGLLFATLIVAIGLGAFAPRLEYANRQRAVAAMVEKYGGLIRYDFDLPLPYSPPSANHPTNYRFFRKVLGDDYFDTAVEVQLGDGIGPQYAVSALPPSSWKRVDKTLGDDDFKVIVTLNKLRVLKITNSAVTDAAACRIGSLVDLEELELHTRAITDRAVDHIVRLPKLRRLRLSSRGITDASVEEIGSMQGLQTLNLSGTSVTREGLNRLHELLPKTWINH